MEPSASKRKPGMEFLGKRLELVTCEIISSNGSVFQSSIVMYSISYIELISLWVLILNAFMLQEQNRWWNEGNSS